MQEITSFSSLERELLLDPEAFKLESELLGLYGKHKIKTTDGRIIVGDFNKGQLEGDGTIILANKKGVLTGQFKKGYLNQGRFQPITQKSLYQQPPFFNLKSDYSIPIKDGRAEFCRYSLYHVNAQESDSEDEYNITIRSIIKPNGH